MSSSQSKLLTVLMIPDGRDANPYQSLLAESLEQRGIKVFFPQGYRRIFPMFREVVVRNLDVDIIHLHWIFPYLKGENRITKTFYAVKLLADVILTKWFGVRIIWTIHNRLTHDTAFPKIELWVRSNLARLADGIILHNQATLEPLAQEYGFSPSKATVILHGHYRGVYKPPVDSVEARRELGLPLTGIVFLSLGLLRPYKGIEKLLEVWCDNQQNFSDCTLLIAGKASEVYAEKLRQKISDLTNIVLIPKFIEDDRIHLFFSAATVTVLPYQITLTSGSLILAMSYGLPVIAPRLSSIPEYLGNADRLLYDPQDHRGLLKAMETSTYIDLKQLSQLVVTACERLNWSEIGCRTSQLYDKILNQFKSC